MSNKELLKNSILKYDCRRDGKERCLVDMEELIVYGPLLVKNLLQKKLVQDITQVQFWHL
tara:strand:+ start:404 stop:583 length:180 start_codon:yes stop_codon:yes gene_type:complete